MAFLKVVEGGNPGQIVELIGDRMVMGRHPSCEIVLDNAAVSRHHAQVLHSHGNYFLEDLRSRNRTFLNETAIHGRTELQDNDSVKVCDVVFSFHLRFPGDPSSSYRTGDSTASNASASAPAAESAVTHRRKSDSDSSSESGSQNSSIVSTINAKTGTHLRLSVKPEIKLRALLSIGRALAQTLQLDDVLQRTLDELFKVFPQAEEGFCVLADPATGKPSIRATKTRSGADDDSVRVSMTIVEKAMNECKAILSHDALADAQFDHSDSVSKLQIRSMMCVPLLDPDGKALGVIQLDARDLRDQFSADDLELLVSTASPIALAVDNARLHQQVLKQRQLEQEQRHKTAEMTLAMHVQHDFLPSQPPDVPGTDSATPTSRPMRSAETTSTTSKCPTAESPSRWGTWPERACRRRC
ncbi:MAG: FHA domain-containing protein [Planctomycetaceae bacterium]